MPTQKQMEAMMLIGQAMDAVMMSGDLREAIRLFTRALQLDPSNGEIYHNRGMANANLGNLREAIADFTQAIRYSPHPSSYEQRGTAYAQVGDRPSARRDWEQALRLAPGRANPLMNLGWIAVEERRFRDAIDYYSRAISAEPTLAAAYANRAKVYYELGDRARAFADLQEARDLVESGRDTSNQDTRD